MSDDEWWHQAAGHRDGFTRRTMPRDLPRKSSPRDTTVARAALRARFASPEERSSYYTELGRRSGETRRAKRAARDAAAEIQTRTAASRAACGLPPKVTDPATLATVAAIVVRGADKPPRADPA